MKPTQAQIDAAAKAFAEYDMMHCPSLAANHAKDKRQAIAAALTAAAEAGEDKAIEASANELIEQLGRERDIKLATIERCAQVAENYKANEPETIGNMGYKFQIATAIRAMKDKP